MTRPLPLLLLFVLAAPVLAQSGDKVFDETYTFRAGDDLSIATSSSDIYLRTGTQGEARVEVLGRGRDLAEGFERLNFRVEREGDRLVVKTEREGNGWWRNNRASFDLVITAPERLNLNVTTSSGDIEIGQIEGAVSIATSSGDVEIGTVRGPLAVTTSSGDIEANQVEGNVEVSTSSGDLDMDTIRGAGVSFSTSSGDFDVDRIDADSFRASSSSGDFSVGSLGGNVEVSTSSGDVSLGDVEGNLAVSTSSGDLRADLAKPGRIDINTGSGGVRLRAPASLAADIDIRGGSIRIDRDFRFAGQIKDRSAEGQIGGGGSMLRVRTGSGTVSLAAR